MRAVSDSNGCKRFCRPVTKPLIQLPKLIDSDTGFEPVYMVLRTIDYKPLIQSEYVKKFKENWKGLN